MFNASTSFQSLKIDYTEDKPPLEPASIYYTLGLETVPGFPTEEWLVFHVIQNLFLLVRGKFRVALIKASQSLMVSYAFVSYHYIRFVMRNMSL
jgi:hypothetical protein